MTVRNCFTRKLVLDVVQSDIPCPYCNVILEKEDHEHLAYASIDHVVPYSKSLNNSYSNLILACTRCNSLKSDKESFMTFKFYQKTKIDKKELDDICYHFKYSPIISILEEIRVLVLNNDIDSITYYQTYIKDVMRVGAPGRRQILNMIRKILVLSEKPYYLKDDKTLVHLHDNKSYNKENIVSVLSRYCDSMFDEISFNLTRVEKTVANYPHSLVHIEMNEIKEELTFLSELDIA